MMITTKGRNALKVMIDLAQHNDGTNISLTDIAERQHESAKYLEAVMGPLSAAGLVLSARGKSGGYRLTRAPEEYTVGDILRTTEGSLAPVACLDGNADCTMAKACVTVEIWAKIEEAVNHVVDNITLADLVRKYNEKSGGSYVI